MTIIADAPAWLVIGAAIVIVATVGIVDLRSEPYVAFSSLYVLPVLLASWRGRASGMAVAAIGATVWTLAHGQRHGPRSSASRARYVERRRRKVPASWRDASRRTGRRGCGEASARLRLGPVSS